jgi:hypothetical protein
LQFTPTSPVFHFHQEHDDDDKDDQKEKETVQGSGVRALAGRRVNLEVKQLLF